MATCKRTSYVETRVIPFSELKKIRDQLKRGEIASSVGLSLMSALAGSVFQKGIITALGITAGMFDTTFKSYLSGSNVAQEILDGDGPVNLRVEYRCINKQRDCYCQPHSIKRV